MPGSNRTYQEVSTEFVRDHMIQRQVQFRDIVAAQVVTEIRVRKIRNFLHFILLFDRSAFPRLGVVRNLGRLGNV
jgi:hypothetical protein